MQLAAVRHGVWLSGLASPAPSATRSCCRVAGGMALPSLPARPSRLLALTPRAAKGFGKTKPPPRKAGDAESDDEPASGAVGGAKRKGRRLRQTDVGPIPGQDRPLAPPQPSPQSGMAALAPDLLVPAEPSAEESGFEDRLAVLKDLGRQRAAASAAAAAADPLASPVPGVTPGRAVFDPAPPGEDIYANPPPLAATLMAAAGAGGSAADISDPKLRDAPIGPSQLGVAGGALLLVAVFVLVAAGEYAPASKRYAGVRPAQSPPDPIEAKILASKVALYEEQLKADPGNDDALEALGSSYAKLQQYDKAADLYERFTKRNPTATEAYRLLGEASLLAGQPKRAVPALERAVELRRAAAAAAAGGAAGAVTQPDLQLLTGLTDSYIASGSYAKAIDTLTGLRGEIAAAAAAAAAAGATAAAAAAASSVAEVAAAAAAPAEVAPAEVAAPAAAVAAPEAAAAAVVSGAEMLSAPPLTDDAAGDAASSSSSTSGAMEAAAVPAEAAAPSAPAAPAAPAASPSAAAPVPVAAAAPARAARALDPVSVELLCGKVYAAWRGHDTDAVAVYDRLIREQPEDYRGYLAKGVWLKDSGRKADAERMFLQARFYAPAAKQSLVRAIADSAPALTEAPPDNN